MFKKQIKDLLTVNLNLQKGESLLLFTDTEKKELVELMEDFVSVASELTDQIKYTIYKSTKMHGKEPPEELWRLTFGNSAVNSLIEEGLFERILEKDIFPSERVIHILKEKSEDVPSAVVAFSYFSTTHTFFRKSLTEVFGARYASMPLFDPSMFLTSMAVNWEDISKLSKDIADILTEAEWVYIHSDQGTELEFSVKGRKGFADTGLFHNPGDYGNLPAGEAFIAPLETEAYGKLVILYAPDRKLERPLTFKFIEGGVESIEGFEDYRYFIEEVFKSMPFARFIAEFGVGTNPKASRADNVLEAEKILGTVHVALGDNHTFGGTNKVGFHTDYVVFEPTVRLGGRGWEKELLQRGKLRKI